MEYRLNFLLEEPRHCNLGVIREFYANMRREPRTQVVTIWGVEVNITPLAINRVFGTMDVPTDTFTELQFIPHIGPFATLSPG